MHTSLFVVYWHVDDAIYRRSGAAQEGFDVSRRGSVLLMLLVCCLMDHWFVFKSAAEKPKQADGPLFLMVSTEHAAAYPHRT